MIQDAIPEGFSRRHIRMVAGLLGLVAGIGLVVSGFVAGNHKSIQYKSLSK